MRGLSLALLITAGLLLPVIVAIWTVPDFVTQDGPTHLYNAWILSRSSDPRSPYQAFYQVNWQPVPNWAGHLALAGLLLVVSPWTADRIMMTVTLLGLPLASVWLRWKVRGDRSLQGACLLAAMLAMNLTWLLGFTSFLLGCVLFPITLGVWWSARDNLGYRRIASIGLLLVLGYFCHLVSLGLTLLALGVLALFAPAEREPGDCRRPRLRRLVRSALCVLPVVPLAFRLPEDCPPGGADAACSGKTWTVRSRCRRGHAAWAGSIP